MKIKFIPTGNIFDLPKAEIDRIMRDDRGNYEVLDENYTLPNDTDIEEKSVYNQIVQEEKEDKQEEKEDKQEEKEDKEDVDYTKMTNPELYELCVKRNIKVGKKEKKENMIALLKGEE